MEDKRISKAFHFASYTEKDRTEEVKKMSGAKYVEYGKDNDYPEYLNEVYLGSPTHKALVDSISYMIVGNGLQSSDTDARLEIAKLGLDETALRCAVDLKIHGGYYLECIWSQDNSRVAEANHIPFEKVRVAEKNDDGEVDGYWYSNDWSKVTRKGYRPEWVPMFSTEERGGSQILCVKPFSVGSDYYPKPDYLGALNYIELEKEISTFHINNIKNGLFPSAFIIWKNGIPDVRERNKLMAEMENDLGGAKNAGKMVNLFSDGQESAPEVVAFDSNNADSQYEFLSKECTDKIMIGHRVVTPAIFGVKTAGQLGQQEELKMGEEIFMRTRVSPLRKILLKGFETVLTANGIGAPISFEKQNENVSLSKDPLQELLDAGEEISDEWELIDSQKVEGEPIDMEKELFARVPSSNPNGRSKQDTSIFKVRYKYDGSEPDEKSRDFCTRMMRAKKVYRYEDINAASSRPVNKGWGPNGADTYNLWLYKGGGNCRHFWQRVIYMRKNNKKIETVAEARRIIQQLDPNERAEAKWETNDTKVSVKPRNMDNNGFLNPR